MNILALLYIPATKTLLSTMADTVEVRGTIEFCLERLQDLADQYQVKYRAVFLVPRYSADNTVQVCRSVQPQAAVDVTRTVRLTFHYRNESGIPTYYNRL